MKDDQANQAKPWLAYYDDYVPESVDYEDITIPDFLKHTAERFPQKTAFIFQGYKVTYAQFDEMVSKLAGCLTSFGVKKGSAVAILLPNIIPCPVSFYGALKIGAVAVMNNPLYTDRELAHQFNDSGAEVLITLDLLANRMIDLRGKTGIKKIIYTSIGDYLPFPKSVLFPFVGKKKGLSADVKPADGVFKWKDIMARYPANDQQADLSVNDVAIYQYTGGTTGVSKGAILTHRNLSSNVQQADAWTKYKSGEEAMLGALPFFHVMGLTISMNLSIYKGWANILVPKPQPDQLLEAITKFRPTLAPLVPTMFIGLLHHPEIENSNLSSIKMCFSGSAPLPVEVIRDFERKTGSVIIEAFGMTESSPAVLANPMGEGRRKTGSVGVPFPDTICRIVDLGDGKTELPPETEGELVVRGPQVMAGYLNMPEETAKTIVNGWLHSGDIAKMDHDGYFFIVDRVKDMILSGGYNVYPRDIEEVLYENPKIQEVCCIGVPHPSRGEQIKAFIVLKENETADEKEMIAFCAERLARYKLPTMIEFRDELPKSNVGKILRKDLRLMELKEME